MRHLLTLCCLAMFSSLTRAFVTPARRLKPALFLSTGAPGGDNTSLVDRCQSKIADALQATDVTVTGAYDDPNGSHISITVVSPLFQGKRAVQRQQLVYKAIWEELQGPVHAVDSMICQTPDEQQQSS